MTDIPTWLKYDVLGGSIAIIATLVIGLNRVLVRAVWGTRERRTAVLGASVVLVGWFFVALWLGRTGVYRAGPDDLPTIQFGILLPILAGVALAWVSPAVARLIDAVPGPWLVMVQLYRVLGFTFLVLYAAGRLPGFFAWPAGLGDMLVGGLAPAVALAYSRDPKGRTSTVILWNALGILDMTVAVVTGFLTSPSRIQPFAFDPQNELITAFPLVLIPTFIVPLSILLHLASLTQLEPLRHARAVPARPSIAGRVP
jgi:hypothetical protein